MTRLLASLATLVAVAAFLSASVPSAHACSCVPFTAQGYVDGADVIAIGTVIQLIGDEDTGDGPNDLDARVSVTSYLKGTGPAEIVVDDPPSGASCGFLDEGDLGDTYLLFLTGSGSPFESTICSGNVSLDGSTPEHGQERLDEVQAITGPGVPPEGVPSQSGADTPWLVIGLASGLGAAILLAASAFLLRRRMIGRG